MKKRVPKMQRQEILQRNLSTNPFITDEDLAEEFNCSIQTIRLDRLELGIPEVRERMKQVAEKNYTKVRSVINSEIVGELVELELGKKATSIMEVTSDMVSMKSKVCRGHHIFSQANMLAMALIDADVVLTGSARVRYRRPVYLKEKVIATAFIARNHGNKHLVKVVSKVGAEEVFTAKFIIVSR
ncbi:Acyl-coenzyme A thioesterase PaaI, contains HGG motif [Desulfonispora thiosulfatigenes DSM 11270]|uniref:Acyl-coenzyme A thioesterase PaaI, contains HGG motif n=1 Tax=Desulfonispora thiosulfatigenes DSM 11270 TaxID=656914 RepID=A0A1W1VJV0_DESTI|nr:transcription factor FapR [Desulfonispora thiosulfatigenes]SMB93596.1 Acyl-coenzyme A thioesterase PaaI, contains HGG motif [Desulfonispora thiosulfatigenes DSM 11270]